MAEVEAETEKGLLKKGTHIYHGDKDTKKSKISRFSG